jgi:hypothetical protein
MSSIPRDKVWHPPEVAIDYSAAATAQSTLAAYKAHLAHPTGDPSETALDSGRR